MGVSRLVAILGGAAVAAALALPATPAYAVSPNEVYVTAGGTDNPTCSQATPCATVGAAVLAVADIGTIHVGIGTFDGPIRPGAVNKSVTIDGVSPDQTTLTNSGLDGFVVEVDSHTTTLSNLTASGGLASTVLVMGGVLVADHVVLQTAGCVVGVLGGEADVTDSTIQGGGHGGASCDVSATSDPTVGDVGMAGGTVSLVRTRVLSPDPNQPGVKVKAGTFSADQTQFDDSANDLDTNNSDGVQVKGGAAIVSRSTFHGFGGSGVHTVGGTSLVTDSTFQGNIAGVTGADSGAATVVRSTFDGELAALQQETTGTLSVAGTIMGPDLLTNCAGSITDLGYNLATDATCALTATGSHDSRAGLNLAGGLDDRGGPLFTDAILNPSSAVDTIPTSATYGVTDTPLCPATGTTDLRGVPRPVGGKCDAGSMEMAGTTTTLHAPAKATPHADVRLDATVDVPQVIDGLEFPVGTVTFRSDGTVLCAVQVHPTGDASCTTSALGKGAHVLTATFAPANDSTLHRSKSAPRTIEVGTTPAFTSTSHVTFVVGTSKTFQVHATGSPAPRITQVKGKLPAGLTFHAGNGRATISGKAKASGIGTHRITLQAKNVMGKVRQVLLIVVKR